MINSVSFAARDYIDFEEKIKLKLATIPFKPTLAFVFLSIEMPVYKIIETFKENNIRLIGASSCGELLFDDTLEVISDNGIVVTITDIKKEYFFQNMFNRKELNSFDFGNKIGEFVKEKYENPSIIITASGLSLDGQELVEGILSGAGEITTMFGGLAGDDSKFKRTITFNENGITESGANVLVLDADKISVKGLATSGWVGLGAELEVTKSSSNIVYEIGGLPALEVYTNYLSVNVDELPAIGIEYPLMIIREDNVEALRAVLGIDKDKGALIFAGSVPEGSIVTFSSSPGFDVVDNTISEVEKFYNAHPDGDLFLLFSCMARHLALGPMIVDEISLASKKWDAPVIGFFTYGEIGSNENKTCDFYNQTYSLVQLTEK